jgi:saccharopine dehydrogenase-like NADP-dependent oxidoreductase
MKVLVIGGYGTFGGRLVRLLADRPQLTLLVAGRSSAKARSCCSRNAATANLVPLAFDRDGDVIGQLRDAAPDIVVDASGPFQVYGDDPYAVVKACIALRIDYIDLADSSAFVDGIAAFDEGARQRNLFVLSGVSSFPVLTVAVARRLAQGMVRIDAVSAGIAPSPFAEVGLNVFRAIASYAGKALAVLRDGREIIAYALIDSRTFTIAPPGHVPLRPRRFTLIDAPELHVLPTLFPHLKSVWVGAGTVPGIFHRCLTLCAFLVRLGLLQSLLPFAAIMHAVRNRLSWGEDRGGMFVAISGWDGDGNPIEREWHMIAEGDDGPFIPAMAAAAVIGHVLNGRRPPGGARDGTADVKLTDFEEQFSRRRIFAGVREKSARPRPLYRRLLGSAYDTLPPTLQRLHDLDCHLIAEGRAKIERGRGILARLIAMAFGFPPAGNDIPIAVDFRCDKACEVWRRSFAGREFSSIQEEGRGGFDRLLHERFGPATFGLALVVEAGRLRLLMRRWSLFGVAMPIALAPVCDVYEYEKQGRFHFFVDLGLKRVGLIVRYQVGWSLVPRNADGLGGPCAHGTKRCRCAFMLRCTRFVVAE